MKENTITHSQTVAKLYAFYLKIESWERAKEHHSNLSRKIGETIGTVTRYSFKTIHDPLFAVYNLFDRELCQRR